MDKKDPKCTVQLSGSLEHIAAERGQELGLVKMMDETAKELGGPGVAASYKLGVCSMCGKKPEGFIDDLSRKEWAISRLCQGCQDECFKEPEEHYGPDDTEPAF